MKIKMDASSNQVEYVSSRGVMQRGEVVDINSDHEITVLNHLGMPVKAKEWRQLTDSAGKIILHLCFI